MASMDVAEGTGVSIHSAEGRWIIAATALGSAVAMLDGTVVGIALPTIGRDFGAGLSTLQWTVTAYTLTLSALILIGGSLGDHDGRRRVFVIGVVWFAAASLLCGVALNASMLIAARALQGVGGAMLTPGSLAIIQSSFRREDRAQAIGFWSGLSGVATAIGPFVGGYLITAASWRWIFLLNLPLVAAGCGSRCATCPTRASQACRGVWTSPARCWRRPALRRSSTVSSRGRCTAGRRPWWSSPSSPAC